MQVPDGTHEGVSLIQGLTMRAISPISRAVVGVGKLVSAAGERLALRRQLVEENRSLRAQIDRLREEAQVRRGLEQEVARLSAAVDYARQSPAPLRIADIVYVDHTSWLKTLMIHAGEEKTTRNQPVVSPDGLVGRIIVTSGPYAKVQLVTDRSASVGAMIVRTRRQGVVRGDGDGALQLDFIPLQVDVRPGDQVVTAGIDGVYPRQIPIGTVTEVEQGNELFHRIRLVPAVDFGVLSQVYVLDREPLSEELTEAVPDAGS